MKIRTFADVKVNIKTEDILKENVIYCLTFENGKCYVGQTSRALKLRLQEHCRNAYNVNDEGFNQKKSNAIRKYMAFSVSILYQGSDLEAQEEYHIKRLDTVENGYNHTYSGSVSGGFTGKTHSEDTLEKMRANSYWKGRNLTDEMKANLSEKQKERFKDPEQIKANRAQKHSKAVNQYDQDGKFIKSYPSVRDAARETGLNRSNINPAIDKVNKNGKPALCGGFIWKVKQISNKLN